MKASTVIACLVAAILASVFLAGYMAKDAFGAPPPDADPNLAPWFQGLTQENGGSCCSEADCRPVDSRVVADHFEAYYDGEWIAIPPDKVRPQKTNPIGRAVLCVYQGAVLCFVPPLEV